MNRSILVFLLTIFVSVNVLSAADPMVSLFKFQSQMVSNGNVEAMMKLGEMYEQGVGTKQDLNKALEMYRQAQAKGKKGAATAIKRIEKKKKYIATAANRAAKQRAAREKTARDKAAREKAARKKAVREKAVRDKAARDRAVREKAARDKAMRDRAVRKKAAHDKAVREKLARDKAARDRAARELAAQEQAAERAAQEEAARKKTAKEKAEEGFTADPCNTPAARFMASCRKKK